MLNRNELFDAMSRLMSERQASGGDLGLLIVRAQRLREFHVLFGYEAAERLALSAQDLIEEVMRPNDEVVRIGECDFAVLLPGMLNQNHALLAASRLLRAFQEPVSEQEHPLQIAIAVGIALFPLHGNTPDLLCRHADAALGEALRSTQRIAMYSPEANESDIDYEELREAILNNRLQMHFQPLLDLHNGTISGAECLARWQTLNHGNVSPSYFVPYAEQTGLISPLTRWSLNTAFRDLAAARSQGWLIDASINLSPRVLGESGMVEHLLGALKIWSVPPSAVVLEVTETAIMEDPGLSARVLQKLRDAGLKISIDDFGTGYSSFSYLKHFPATELKIDQSFIKDMLHDVRAEQLVRSMIDLAHNLQVKVVAEGVENARTQARLVELGCDCVQGFHIGRPQAFEDFVAALSDIELAQRGTRADSLV